MIKLSSIYPATFKNILKPITKHILFIGGRSTGKTHMMSDHVVLSIVQNYGDIVAMRKLQNTLKKSIKVEIDDAILRFGLHEYFEYEITAMRYRYIPNDTYIHLMAIDSDNFKGYKTPNPVSLVWIEETQQFKDAEEIRTIIDTLIKNVGDNYVFIYTGNGDRRKGHWVNKFKSSKLSNPNYGVFNHTYEDIKHLLDHNILHEIEQMKIYDYENYRSTYHNDFGMNAGSIYKKYKEEEVSVNTIIKSNINIMTIGVDYGDSDATTFTLTGISSKFDLVQVPKTYYHKNGVSLGLKDINDYAQDLIKFINECFDEYGKRMLLQIDSASLAFIKVFKKLMINSNLSGKVAFEPLNKMKKIAKHDAIESRIVITNLLLGTGRLKVHESNVELLEAFEMAERDSNDNRLDNGTSNIDSLDSFEYSILKFIEHLYNSIFLKNVI